MKNSLRLPLALPLAMASQLMAGSALAQGSGKEVTVFRMSGPQLGVRLEEVDKDIVSRLKLKEEKGALVMEVVEGSAAEKAGIHKDDVIIRFQGESVLTAAQLSRLVRDVPSGRKVDIDVIRAGAPLKVTATLERGEWSGKDFGPDMEGWTPDMKTWNKEFGEKLGKKFENLDKQWKSAEGGPRAFSFKLDKNAPAWTTLTAFGRGRLGITYTEIEGQLAHYFKAPKDNAILVNSVVEGSAAEKAGIKAGDLLVKLGSASIEEAGDLHDAVSDLEPGKATSATIWRDGRSVELSVTIEEAAKMKPLTRLRRPVS